MNEVSCKVFEILASPLARKGVSIEDVVSGTRVDAATIRNKKQRIDWSDYVAVMRNIRPHFSDEEYREIGRSYMRTPGVRFAFVIARLVFSPMDIYRWFSKPREGVGNQMFTCIVPGHRELAGDKIELTLSLPEGFEMCRDFFLISAGNMEELPRLFGLPRADLKLTELPRGARMDITVPLKVPFFARIWRVLSWPFTARAAARELQEAHETLTERYHELEGARGQLERQATQLRTAHTVNTLVQRDLDLSHTLDTVVTALVEEAEFASAEIVLAGGRKAGYGTTTSDPLERTLEARGGQSLGELMVWPREGANRTEREELLAFVLPSLAMAVENAQYRTELESLVEKRTEELQKARDQLAGTVEQLREAQGARERFFGNISHEIRTPLTLIMLAAADIESRAGATLDPRSKLGLSSVTDSARKLVRLVDELLLLAAGQEGKLQANPEPTALSALIEHLVAAWQPAAEAAGVTLSLRPGAAELVANVDPVAIERVATNLVSNAVKYTPRGGDIEVELADEPDGVRLSVFDTGPGISEDLAGRLFGRYERATSESRRITGTGLGLSLAKQLVEAHGGTIAARPRGSGGCELRVVLPPDRVLRETVKPAPPVLRLVEGGPPRRAPVPDDVRRPAGFSKGRILLAEDDVKLAHMVAELLGEEYTVIVANDGLTAVELVKSEQPELLITDVDMPGIDGLELSQRFREITGDRLAPIIILSAMLDLKTRVAGLEAGATDYITKPFDPIELRARIRAQFRTRELAVRLHRAEQMSQLAVLTSGLAHELRNPANGIVNALGPLSELLPSELLENEHPVGQLVDVIGDCAQQIGALARQLLGFRSGSAVLEKREVALADIVGRATSFASAALSGVDLRLDLADARVWCAPPLLTQVLTNLVENAGHAAGRGGWVSVKSQAGSDHLTIEVADSGPGIPVELRERVFEPFFTTKSPGIGTGLGLPLARDIIHRHGGVLAIRESEGGCRFVIELPAVSKASVAGSAL